MQRRPITVQYPYEKLIPSERYRGRIHYEFDKCIACEVCVRVCPINLPVVDWEFEVDKITKKKAKKLNHYSIDFWRLHLLWKIVWNIALPIVCQ